MEFAHGTKHDRFRVRMARRLSLFLPLCFPMPRFVRARAFQDPIARINVNLVPLSPATAALTGIDQYPLRSHEQVKRDEVREMRADMLLHGVARGELGTDLRHCQLKAN